MWYRLLRVCSRDWYEGRLKSLRPTVLFVSNFEISAIWTHLQFLRPFIVLYLPFYLYTDIFLIHQLKQCDIISHQQKWANCKLDSLYWLGCKLALWISNTTPVYKRNTFQIFDLRITKTCRHIEFERIQSKNFSVHKFTFDKINHLMYYSTFSLWDSLSDAFLWNSCCL